jgi:hypothetical protein
MSRQFLLKTLLFFYLTFSFIGATHIHSDNEEHPLDCQICVIIKAFSNSDLPKDTTILDCTLCSYIVETFYSLEIKIITLKGYFSHAPPF